MISKSTKLANKIGTLTSPSPTRLVSSLLRSTELEANRGPWSLRASDGHAACGRASRLDLANWWPRWSMWVHVSARC